MLQLQFQGSKFSHTQAQVSGSTHGNAPNYTSSVISDSRQACVSISPKLQAHQQRPIRSLLQLQANRLESSISSLNSVKNLHTQSILHIQVYKVNSYLTIASDPWPSSEVGKRISFTSMLTIFVFTAILSSVFMLHKNIQISC